MSALSFDETAWAYWDRPSRQAWAMALADQIAAPICAVAGVMPAVLRVSDRRKHLVRLRWLVWYALERAGLHVVEIARWADRNWSTVHYGLSQAHQMPEIAAEGAAWVTPPTPGYRLTQLYAHPQGPLAHAYLQAITSDAPIRATALCGLAALARDPELRAAALATLDEEDQRRQGWRIGLHARQAGLRWVQ